MIQAYTLVSIEQYRLLKPASHHSWPSLCNRKPTHNCRLNSISDEVGLWLLEQLTVKLIHTCLRWIPILLLGWPGISNVSWGLSRVGTTWMRVGCLETEGIRVTVPVKRVKSLLPTAGGRCRCTWCLSACPRRRDSARKREGECWQSHPALPVAIIDIPPVILPHPLLQLCAVFGCCGGLRLLCITFGAVTAVVTRRSRKHVWPASLSRLIWQVNLLKASLRCQVISH